MKTMAGVLATCLMLLASTCLAQSSVPSVPKEDVAAVVAGGSAFAADLYAKLASGGTGNVFFSPSSVRAALAMTYAGAGGDTARQMAKTLHFTLAPRKLNPAMAELLSELNNPPLVGEGKDKKPAYQLVVANALWGQKGYGFKPDFTRLLQSSYSAGLNEVDFVQAEQARKTINDWAARQTHQRIKDLVPMGSLTAQTRMVLTNAIYFKNDWDRKFPKEAAKDGPFKLSEDQSADVALMHVQTHLGYMENDDLQMLELPYVHNELSMVVFLPRKLAGLEALEKKFSAEQIGKWLSAKQTALVELTLPKFTFSTESMLAQTLRDMGMADAFDGAKADFSGMTDREKLCISEVIHKAFVAVDEEGTEAAAATAVVMFGGAPTPRKPEEVKVFKADHPFLFLIRHNVTGEILFLGRLANPKGPA